MKMTSEAKQSGPAWPWVGQSRLGAALLTMLKVGRWPATAMFSGPEHLGKSTVATWLAQRDLCSAVAAPCGTCTSCRAFVAGTHSDCLIIAPNDDHRFDSEEMSRTLLGLSWKRPSSSSGRRWVIIADADRLSEHVSNTLLKLIEEPPPDTTILLTSSHPERLLSTILSRVVNFRWTAVSAAELDRTVRKLSGTMSVSQRQTIIAQAAGRPGRLMKLLADPSVLEREWTTTNDLINALTSGRLPDRSEWTAADLDQVELIIRDALLAGAHGQTRHWPERSDQFQTLAHQLGMDRLHRLARRLMVRSHYFKQHVQPSLFLHDLIL